MLATQTTIEALAERIERAYRLRRPGWYRGCSSARVFAAAAATLFQLHQDNPTFPLDPELYVAVQLYDAAIADPWTELTQPSSAHRYRNSIRAIVRVLRDELRGEVRSAEQRVAKGEAVGKVLTTKGRSLSPMGCYIVALRAGCEALAEHFRVGAVEQHQSCPLYRLAIVSLLSRSQYPVADQSAGEELFTPGRTLIPLISLN